MPLEMKLFLPLLVCLPLVLRAGEPNAKLEALPVARYQAMLDRSPFALASESAPQPPPQVADTPGFAKDLVLTGAVRLNDGEYITIASKDASQRFSLRRGETYNEISLVSVAWSDAVGKTRATLKRGTEYGTIGFDEAAIRAGAGAEAPPNGGNVAGGSPPQPGNPGPNGQPNANQPNANQPAAPGQPGSAVRPPSRAVMRRLVPIRTPIPGK